MKFFGEFKGQLIDPKGRLTIPKSLRAGLNELAAEPQIFLQTYDTGILWIFTQSKLQSDVEQIDAAKDTHLELENYYRTLHPVSLDSQGRLLIPSLIRESVATGSKVNVIGAGEYIKLDFQSTVDELHFAKGFRDKVDQMEQLRKAVDF